MATKKGKHYDLQRIKDAARKRWDEILSRITGFDASFFDGKHHSCPKCGGTDRFRFTNKDDNGSVICNQCGRSNDGIGTIEWATGCKFQEALALVADYLGIEPDKSEGGKRDPEAKIEWQEWSDYSAGLCLAHRPPCTLDGLKRLSPRICEYYNQYTCVALPLVTEGLKKVTGWTLMRTVGTLPVFKKREVVDWVKIKQTAGTTKGIICTGNLAEAKTVWKTEGVTDLIALCGEISESEAAFTNPFGAKEDPKNYPWLLELLADKEVIVIHDCDRPGQEGATWVENSGQQRPGWATALSTRASVRNVVLPYEIAEDHGKDLRDYLMEHSWADLMDLADSAEVLAPPAAPLYTEKRCITDPVRLAQINLDEYRAAKGAGATLRYWQGEWYRWRGKVYERINVADLKSKLGRTIDQEFAAENVRLQEEKGADETPEMPRLTASLISDVLLATTTLDDEIGIPITVSWDTEPYTWLGEDGSKARRQYLAVQNGVLDIESLLQGDGKLLPHSPRWWSHVYLPYDYDPKAECPFFQEYIQTCMEGDPERIRVLQEWAGYCLLPQTGEQRFLANEGEGANGKTVYTSVLEALVGSQNCSHVALEQFQDRFVFASMNGKLINICGDVGELDRMAEGRLKDYTGSSKVTLDRKNKDAITVQPTARLILSWNNRPRIHDRSDGVWRRLILVPWRITIPEQRRIKGMANSDFWESHEDMPGILNWALEGLRRLRQQGGFSQSTLVDDALSEYRDESNPAGEFLRDACFQNEFGEVCSEDLYEEYSKWAKARNYSPLGERVFGREIRRIFPFAERKQKRRHHKRSWFYTGISLRD